jgi:hypothetical protein
MDAELARQRGHGRWCSAGHRRGSAGWWWHWRAAEVASAGALPCSSQGQALGRPAQRRDGVTRTLAPMGFQGMRKSTVMPNHGHEQRRRRASPVGVGRITVSFRPAIPWRVAPRQSPLPLRRPRQCTSTCHCAAINTGVRILSHPWWSISRSRNQHTARHSRAPSRQSSETKHLRREDQKQCTR